MNLLGLDLSLTATGVSDGNATWLIRSAGTKTDDLAARADRLSKLAAEILSHAGHADLVLIEGPSFASSHGHAHDRAGLWWLVVYGLHTAGVATVEIPPTVLKKYATGKGNVGKGQVIDATARRFPDVDTAADDNRCDALWLAAIGHDLLGTPLIPLPETHRAALDSVRLRLIPDAA